MDALYSSEIFDALSNPTTSESQKIDILQMHVSQYQATSSLIFPKISSDFRANLCAYLSETFHSDESLELNKLKLQLLRISLRDKSQSADHENPNIENVALLIFGLDGLIDDEKFASKWIANEIELITEASMCLINLAFNSPKTRQLFHERVVGSYLQRISFSQKILEGTIQPMPTDLGSFSYLLRLFECDQLEKFLLYDMKLAFILSALNKEITNEWINNANTLETFVSVLRISLAKLSGCTTQQEMMANTFLAITNEALRTIFNLYHPVKVFDMNLARKFAQYCIEIVVSSGHDVEPHLRYDLHTCQNAINVLSLMPAALLEFCRPKETKDMDINEVGAETPNHTEETDKSVEELQIERSENRFVAATLDLLEQSIDQYERSSNALLATYLSVLLYLCSNLKQARRYCRMKVIPPLTAIEVERRPDEGNDLRNKIVRLIGSSSAGELASEFLFILCKRSASRMIKYCGFGHSAGLFANYGCLGSAIVNTGRRESDSEDSETEDYKSVENKINPVTGKIENEEALAEWKRKMDEMSEEQKEFEVMQLVNCMDKLMDRGVIQPGRIGDDGRPQTVEHVCQLLENGKSLDQISAPDSETEE